jgi:hypothetical protein
VLAACTEIVPLGKRAGGVTMKRWAAGGAKRLGLRWQAQRDTALDFAQVNQRAVVAALCRRTP